MNIPAGPAIADDGKKMQNIIPIFDVACVFTVRNGVISSSFHSISPLGLIGRPDVSKCRTFGQ